VLVTLLVTGSETGEEPPDMRVDMLSTLLSTLLLVVGAHGVRVSPGGLGLGREEVAQPQKPVLLGGDSSTWSYSASTAPSSYSVFDTWATKHGKPYAGAGLNGGLEGPNGASSNTLRGEFHKRLTIFEANVAFVHRLIGAYHVVLKGRQQPIHPTSALSPTSLTARTAAAGDGA
jgi:hypothetical protein